MTVTHDEIRTAINAPEEYILALVEVEDGQARRPRYVRRPFGKEPDFGVTSVNYDLKELLQRSDARRWSAAMSPRRDEIAGAIEQHPLKGVLGLICLKEGNSPMEWKTIRNAGHIHSQAELPKGERFAAAAEFLEGMVEEFARASYRYYDMVKELPFIYRERQLNSVLLPAIAETADASLVEMPITRKKRRSSGHGWIDYWACYQEVDLLIEVKHGWHAVDSGKIQAATATAWQNLKKQLDALSPETVDYTIWGQPLKVALLIVPCYQGSKYETGVESLDRTATTELYDLVRDKIGEPGPNWSSIWHLHRELQQAFQYDDDWYELHPCVIFLASVLKFE